MITRSLRIYAPPDYEPDAEMLEAYDEVKSKIESTTNALEFNKSPDLIWEHYEKYKDDVALQYLLRVKDDHAKRLIMTDFYNDRKNKNKRK